MIKINDTIYDLDIEEIIIELREQLLKEDISLFNTIKHTDEDLMVSCPYHKGGQEKKPSCGIRKSDGFLHCFACGASHSLTETISNCFGKNDLGKYGIKWLQNNFLGDIAAKRDLHLDLSRTQIKTTPKYVTEEELDSYRYIHPYMFKRKMTEEMIELFDIGYDKDTECITFPVRDEQGNCLFIARRNVNYKFFNYPTNVDKPIYGLYELSKLKEQPKEIIVCESMINCITCWVFGRPAIALNGTGTKKQLDKLKQLEYRKLILGLDPDSAGQHGCDNIYKHLKDTKLITKLVIPTGKDINDLSKEEFLNLPEILM